MQDSVPHVITQAGPMRGNGVSTSSSVTLAGVLPTSRLVPFLLTVYVLILVPGPSVLFVVSRGVALGRRAAFATVLGNTGGLAFQGALVCAGLGSLLAKSDAVFTTLKLIGAAYLIILGIRT